MTRTKKSPEIRNVVLYSRVSTLEQAEKDLSIPAQLDALRRHCTQHGYAITNEYVEPGFSAHHDDDRRPVFRQMIADVMAPESQVQAILVCYTSRFYRNRANSGAMKALLRRRGVRVLAIYQATTDDPMGQFVDGIFELVDQYESDVNGMRTSAAMRKNAELGFHNGSKAPYGFTAEAIEVRPGQIKRRLVPNPQEVATHNEVVRQYIAKQGAKGAARDLNQRGYRYRDDKLWTKDLVLKVIEETAAVGTYAWGKGTPEPIQQKVEPIIDRELFEMAQRVRQLRDPKKNPGRTPSSPLLLAGLVVCGHPGCGASYQLETSGKTADTGVYDYRYYNCRNHLRIGKEKCSGFRIRAEVLEKAVLEHLADRLFTVERCTQIVQDMVEETGMLRQKTAEHRRQLQKELEAIEKRVSKWQDAFESGDKMATALGADRVVELKAMRDELQQQLRKVVLLRPPPPNLYTEARIQTFRDSIRSIFLSGDNALTKNYLRFLVDKIIVNGPKVQMVTRSEAVVRIMAAGGTTVAEPDPANSPAFAVEWLRLLDSKWPEVLQSRGLTEDSRADESTRVDVSARELVPSGPSEFRAVGTVENALALALLEASRASRWEIVEQLLRELEARRLAMSTSAAGC
jgi:site-specific DNA recombinase